MSKTNLENSTFIFSSNATYIQELYQQFLKNPNSLEKDWQEYFNNIGDDFHSLNSDYKGATWKNKDEKVIGIVPETTTPKQNKIADTEYNYKIKDLINCFRKYGHLNSNLDPLQSQKLPLVKELSPQHHKITPSEFHKIYDINPSCNFHKKSIKQIIENLQSTYCQQLGFEFDHVTNQEESQWLYKRVEQTRAELSKSQKLDSFQHLHNTASFEQMLHKKFPGAKRFSIEGADITIAAIEEIITQSGKQKINNIEIGMAHRGRLNVLVNILKKPVDQMIAEFMGKSGIPSEYNAMGDVKYHMGFSSDRNVNNHKVYLSLAYNPSHLEAVNSVILGKIRAKQDLENDTKRLNSLPILIHGDAAFMGQGCVAETFNMAYTEGYFVGGTIHMIINNQIGFTANSLDSRSTKYCSDIAKMIEAPIIHTNGDDVEANILAAQIAIEYRQKFQKDIIIDINCYRKYGHNEGDEPNYTQPIMYSKIKNMKSLDQKYAQKLISENIISKEELDKTIEKRHQILENEFQKAQDFVAKDAHAFSDKWKKQTTKVKSKKPNPPTNISKKTFDDLAEKLTSYPNNFNINKKIAKQFEIKKQIINDGNKLDWSLGEAMAFASLLDENYPIRITGQDAKRGTFSHRHSVLVDSANEASYIPLNHIKDNQSTFEVHNSVLSEYTIQGYEYGYSLANPDCLTIWEAQFGDFNNGAQIIFDQFISSAETKWLRMSGLVLFLPHGYEGQGPEHSSARIERYLQACAEDNIQVANITTPANFFHILRRQLLRDFRKPLLIATPKSLLRNKMATSSIDEFTKTTHFLPVIEDNKIMSNARKHIFCTGKIYYDIIAERDNRNINDIAVTRIEELYPYPETHIKNALVKHKNAEIIWAQEEPENMGCWNYIDRKLEKSLIESNAKYKRPKLLSRIEAASPATGYMSVHTKEQTELINQILAK